MKRRLIFVVIVLLSCTFGMRLQAGSTAQSDKQSVIGAEKAQEIAVQHLSRFTDGSFTIASCSLMFQKDQPLAWVFHLNPVGYVVVPVPSFMPKVLAYSFESNFGVPDALNPLYQLIKADIGRKLDMYAQYPGIFDRFEQNVKNTSGKREKYDQWPANGNGWVKTNYTQTAPYNDFCPMDPVSQTRSYAGCPSVAMAMILDFFKCTNNTVFDDNDDYYHAYAGRNYQIDDDYETIDFASFPQLNEYLATANEHWQAGTDLTATDEAALVFACGVACKQVYTSEGSGTFGVNQALDAYLRFGFSTVSLVDENDADLWDRLKENIIDTLPAHLAVVDEAWQTGHNVVVDGYNTDEYYHINFGWGGSYNGWYLLPEEFPMGLTVVEGIVLDIMKDTSSVAAGNIVPKQCSVYPNPSGSVTYVRFSNPDKVQHSLTVYNSSGQVLETITGCTDDEIKVINEGRPAGLYFFVLRDGKGRDVRGEFVVAR